jgi:hypothetical protein
MSSPIADGVMAATHRLVQQAMTGQWQDVPKTIEERRVLLQQLSAAATPQDQLWLSALKQAMAESDAVVASMTRAAPADASSLGALTRDAPSGDAPTRDAPTRDAPTLTLPRRPGEGTERSGPGEGTGIGRPEGIESSIDNMLDMIRGK